MTAVNSYRDLLVWQKSMSLVTEIYKVTQTFPSSELYALTNQIRRSAISVPSNIAEGYGRNSTADYKRFLQIAVGSLFELQTQLKSPSILITFQKIYLTKFSKKQKNWIECYYH